MQEKEIKILQHIVSTLWRRKFM